MAKPDQKKRGFLNFLPGFGPPQKDKKPPLKRMGMTVENVNIRLAIQKRNGDQILAKDLKRVEINPELATQEKKEIEEGRQFSDAEWKVWQTTVGNEIKTIKKLERLQIDPDNLSSPETIRILARVWEFRKGLSKDRETKLSKKITRQIQSDMRRQPLLTEDDIT